MTLLELLDAYHPRNAWEQEVRREMLDFQRVHPDCFDRSCKPGHFTASCWLLDHSGQKALLMHHRKLDSWLQLGGHCDGENNLLAVAIREAQEESGINDILPLNTHIFDIDMHLIPARGKDPIHMHYDIRFLLQIQEKCDPIPNNESKGFMWVTQDLASLPTKEKSITRMARKWLDSGI